MLESCRKRVSSANVPDEVYAQERPLQVRKSKATGQEILRNRRAPQAARALPAAKFPLAECSDSETQG